MSSWFRRACQLQWELSSSLEVAYKKKLRGEQVKHYKKRESLLGVRTGRQAGGWEYSLMNIDKEDATDLSWRSFFHLMPRPPLMSFFNDRYILA